MTEGRRARLVTMARHGLRAHRRAAAAVTALGFFAPVSTGATFLAAAGATAASRAEFGRTTSALGAELAYLLPLPLHPATGAGFVWWKGLAFLPLVFAAWALGAATGTIRNEEERGILATWFSAPLGRFELLSSRTVAFAIAALAATVATGLGTVFGVRAAGGAVSGAALAEQGTALLGLTLACWGIGLLTAQLAPSQRAAVVSGGGLLIALYLLDVAARVNPELAGWATLSPFHLVDITTAIVPGGEFAAAATALLYAGAIAALVLSGLALAARDLGAPLWRRRLPVPASPSQPALSGGLQRPLVTALWEDRASLLIWLLGTAAGAAVIVSVARTTGAFFRGSPALRGLLQTAGGGQPGLAVVSEFWFGIAAVLAAAYAVTQTSRWAADDGNGRLEMQLAQPIARGRVVVERALVLLVGLAAVAGVGGLVVAITAPSQGLKLGPGPLVIASALLVPLGLTFGALGALIIARAPRLAVAGLGLVAAASYYVSTLGPALKWPAWALDTSLLHLYGTPLTTGVDWTGLAIMVGVVVLGFGIAARAMGTREIGS